MCKKIVTLNIGFCEKQLRSSKYKLALKQWFLTFFAPRTPKVFRTLSVDPYIPLKEV